MHLIKGDDLEDKFRINEVSGLIETTAFPLDRESRDMYVLVVSVTDSGIPSRVVSGLQPLHSVPFKAPPSLPLTLIIEHCYCHCHSCGCK